MQWISLFRSRRICLRYPTYTLKYHICTAADPLSLSKSSFNRAYVCRGNRKNGKFTFMLKSFPLECWGAHLREEASQSALIYWLHTWVGIGSQKLSFHGTKAEESQSSSLSLNSMIKKRVEFPASLLSIEWNSYNHRDWKLEYLHWESKCWTESALGTLISWVNLPCLAGHFHKEFLNRFPPFKTGGLVWLRCQVTGRCQVKVSRNGPTQAKVRKKIEGSTRTQRLIWISLSRDSLLAFRKTRHLYSSQDKPNQ